MVFDILFEYDRLVVYDKYTDEQFHRFRDALFKSGFAITETHQDKCNDFFWLFKRNRTQVLIQKSTLGALFLYMDKLPEADCIHSLLERCPQCGSTQIDSWLFGAYDKRGLPSPNRHCSTCKAYWHDSKTFCIL